MGNKDYAQLKKFLIARRRRIERSLQGCLENVSVGAPREFVEIFKYPVLNGGKRLRSLLVYAVGEMYGATIQKLDAPASAIELLHAFSLVHDDLPVMDNDTLRRGKPTCHIVFGEGSAILAGDALAIMPFQILSQASSITPEQKILLINLLAKASGPCGLAGGQYLDIQNSAQLTKKAVEKIYHLKTGGLLQAAMSMGAIVAGVKGRKTLSIFEQLGKELGFVFQLQDDIFNIEGDPNKLGKEVGGDHKAKKMTYPALVGLESAKQELKKRTEKVWDQFNGIKADKRLLSAFVDYILKREF